MTPAEALQLAKAFALANRHPYPDEFAATVAEHFTAMSEPEPVPSPTPATTEPEAAPATGQEPQEQPHSWQAQT